MWLLGIRPSSRLSTGRRTFGDDLSGLGVVVEEEHDAGEYVFVDSADIFDEAIDWRKQLEAKTRDFGKLSARYVTG
jgi:hypothetical protein